MPPELVYEIVREAWATIVRPEEWASRWDLYRSISLVSHTWKEAMLNVALRRVAIKTPRDFAIYQCLVRGRWGVDPDSKDVERVHPIAHDYFQHSEMHIVLADWSCPGSMGFVYKTNYAQIPRYIPACKFLEVHIKELPSNDRYTLPYRPLFEFLSQYRTTPTMCLVWTYTHINRYILPTDCVRGVTYLRLNEYPRCVCHNFRLAPGRKHDRECFSFYLPTLFPDLRHIHLETPYILKCLSTLPNVALLTLEAPPIHYTASLGHFSSLSGWNIVSALSMGLFRRSEEPDVDAPRKKIVVNAGPKEPTGWKQVLAACKAHDVELELRHVYDTPVTSGQAEASKK